MTVESPFIGRLQVSSPTYSMINKKVSDLSAAQREAIENLIGGNIAANQRVFVMAYSNLSIAPSEADRRQDREKVLPDSEVSEILRDASKATEE